MALCIMDSLDELLPSSTYFRKVIIPVACAVPNKEIITKRELPILNDLLNNLCVIWQADLSRVWSAKKRERNSAFFHDISKVH